MRVEECAWVRVKTSKATSTPATVVVVVARAAAAVLEVAEAPQAGAAVWAGRRAAAARAAR
eukprot:5584951-Pleurochrysis_carterae.AAC.1